MIGANDTAREYAAAMYALAMEDADAAGKPEKVDEYLSRSEEIRGIIRDFPEWIDMLASPCIRIDERRKAVDEVLLVGKNNDNAGMYENFASLLKLLCDHDEAKLLDTVLSEFAKICNMRSGLVTAEVISAVELSDDEKKEEARTARRARLQGRPVDHRRRDRPRGRMRHRRQRQKTARRSALNYSARKLSRTTTNKYRM